MDPVSGSGVEQTVYRSEHTRSVTHGLLQCSLSCDTHPGKMSVLQVRDLRRCHRRRILSIDTVLNYRYTTIVVTAIFTKHVRHLANESE